MTYAEMLADLKTITNRPDLEDDLAVALRRSTLRMHGLEFWKFDLTTIRLAITVPSYTMSFNTGSALTRFRQICFIKASDSSLTDPMYETSGSSGLPFYSPADVNRLVDEYGKNLSNIFYTTGNIVNIRGRTAPNELYVGYYQRPIVSPVISYQSWIAENYPYAIIDDAAQSVFNTIGLDDKVRLWAARNAEHLQILKTNYLEEESR